MENRQTLTQLILSWRRLFYRAFLFAAVLSVAVSLLLPNWYTGVSTCMPPQEGDSRGGVLQLFTEMGMDFGAGSLLSQTPMSDVMIGILKSRLIRGQVVDRHDLVAVYEEESRDHAIRELGLVLVVNNTPEGLIEVKVDDTDPQLAADLANSFVEFLDVFNRRSSADQARRTIKFIQSTLDSNRVRLDSVAAELRDFQGRHGTVQLTEQTRVTVEAISLLESNKTELEIQKGVLQQFARPGNQKIRELEIRIREIDRKLDQLESGTPEEDPEQHSDSKVLLTLSQIPGLALELAERTREVMVQEKVYTFLTSQLEDARIQLSRDMQVIQVLDLAVPPIKKSRPRRSLIVILSATLTLFLTVILVVAADAYLNYAKKSDAAGTEERMLLLICEQLRKWGGPATIAPVERSNDT